MQYRFDIDFLYFIFAFPGMLWQWFYRLFQNNQKTHIHIYTYSYTRVTSSVEIERRFTFLVIFEWCILRQCQ